VVVNLGGDVHFDPAPEPLLAPPPDRAWRTLWSSDLPRYGGGGSPELDTDEFNWRLPGRTTVVLRPALETPVALAN
jgi:maltooligosyltrehalose trehalohydrolase